MTLVGQRQISGRAATGRGIEADVGPARPVSIAGATALDIAIAGAQLAYETGQPATLAAVAVLDRMAPDDEARMQFLRQGVAQAIQQILDADRVDAIDADEDGAVRARRASVRGSRVLKGDPLADVYLVGADRRLRPLASFSVADWTFLREDAGARAAAFGRRSDVAALALTLLDAESVETAEQLSKKAAARLREATAEAWR